MRADVLVRVVTFITFVVLVFPYTVCAQPLNLVLNGLLDRVDSSIQRAGAVADHLEIRAGNEVYAAIQNTKVAYSEMLDKTLEDVTPAVRGTIDQLRGAVDALERNTANDARDALARAQQVANTLPFSRLQPQITAWSPEVEVVATTGNFTLTLNGNFPFAGQTEMTPTIIVQGQPLSPVGATTQQLIFSVPRTALVPPTGRSVAFANIPVKVPYSERGGLFDFFRMLKREASYSIPLVGLPSLPGQIKVTTFTPRSVMDSRHVRTNQDNQQSDRDDRVEIHCGPTETGHIIHNSVRFRVDRSEGSTWTHRPERYDNPSVCEWIRTEHHGMGISDKVWFHFEYDVETPRSVTDSSDTHLTLPWGNSQVITLAPNVTYRVTFDSFDGQHSEFSAPDHSNRYIEVDNTAAGVRVSARAMAQIRPRQ